jgi:hypothetical protein
MRNLQKGDADAARVLAELVPRITYKPGWSFELHEVDRGQGCEGLTLSIKAEVHDSFSDGMTNVWHLMPVLPAPYAIIETQTREQAHAAALPWNGGAPRDPHFR